MEILELHNINKFFGHDKNRVHVLKNINLSIEKDDFVAIIGQSGSGKSTLMNIIGCLDTPTSGSYKINKTEVGKMSRKLLLSTLTIRLIKRLMKWPITILLMRNQLRVLIISMKIIKIRPRLRNIIKSAITMEKSNFVIICRLFTAKILCVKA